MQTDLENIVDALAVTAEMFGQQFSAQALAMMAQDLAPNGVEPVMAALAKVRRECRRMTIADVLDKLVGVDGRPQPDEAWATAQMAFDEAESVVWTQEAEQAFEIARPLLEINDKTGARMAFRDAYNRLVEKAREAGEPTRWLASLGWDTERRAIVLEAAVTCGRLQAGYAQGLLPPPPPSPSTQAAVLSLVANQGLLTDEGISAVDREAARRHIENLRQVLSGGKAA